MNILVLDDDAFMRDSITRFLSQEHSVFVASSVVAANEILKNSEIDAAIVDLNLGHNANGKPEGLDFLVTFKKQHPDKPVLIESGMKDLSTVVQCMKLGASDYIEKPFDRETLQLKLSKALCDARRSRVLRREFEKSSQELVGENVRLLEVKTMVERAGKMRILFVGETGVGKTPFARYSNKIASEIDGEPRPFEQINCSCLKTDQFEDALFGHKKGAFTNAISDKRGLVELAENGDLFLDEIGDMPLDVQANFLTFLDSMEYYRLGDDKKRKANVRILAATNKNLKQMVEKGIFRADLYSRIFQVVVNIPSLRERSEDIPILFEHFVEKFSGHNKPYDPGIVSLLMEYQWEEGNIRELRDAVEYLCNMGRDAERLEVDHMSSKYRPIEVASESNEVAGLVNSYAPNEIYQIGLENYLAQMEREVLKRCVEQSPDRLEVLAVKLKTSKATLYRRMKRYRLTAGPGITFGIESGSAK